MGIQLAGTQPFAATIHGYLEAAAHLDGFLIAAGVANVADIAKCDIEKWIISQADQVSPGNGTDAVPLGACAVRPRLPLYGASLSSSYGDVSGLADRAYRRHGRGLHGDDEPDGCRGRDERHDGSPIRCIF